jgi:twinkle protein
MLEENESAMQLEDDDDESVLLHKGACDKCGSSDANATYSDDHTHCFSCGHHTVGNGSSTPTTSRGRAMSGLLPTGETAAWTARNLTAETCKKWGISTTDFMGKPARLFQYTNAEGTIVAQKVRPAKKEDMKFVGSPKEAVLYGQHLWRTKGKMVVVTEGEIDAASVSQVQNHKWPVVSVPNGAQGARKALQKHLDWLGSFETVVLMFDNDDAGRKAASECAPLFKPGQCKVARLDLKDANDMLKAGKSKELIDAIWSAKPYRPDGIVDGSDLWDEINADHASFTYNLPFQGLQEMLHGVEPGEVVTFCSGTGMGKSSIVRTLVHHFASVSNIKTGLMFFEETVRRTALGLMSVHAGKNYLLMSDPKSDKDFQKAYKASVANGNVTLYNHFGSTAIENVLDRIRYMAKSLDCKIVVVDHLSILVSGMGEGDERRLIDNAMTALKSVAMECNIVLLLVSHLKRPEGKGHEQGAMTELSQLRGSAAIGQLSDIVIGMERNQQDEKFKNISVLRVLKSRRSGETGIGGWLAYNKTTSRLSELLDDPFYEEDEEGNGKPRSKRRPRSKGQGVSGRGQDAGDPF